MNIWENRYDVKSGFIVSSGFAHRAGCPLITYEIGSAGSTGSEGSEGSTGSTGGGAAHKNMEAPRSIDGGDARRWHFSH